MKTEILIVSHRADKAWLEYNLKSIRKFAEGFSGVTLVVPEGDMDAFLPLAKQYGTHIHGHTLAGHLGAQAQKCLADKHCPEADFILHTDSDCVFTEPVTPEDYFVNGKPVMLIERFSRLAGNPWASVVEKALGFSPAFETMRRHPQVNSRGIYQDMREHIEQKHGVDFISFVMSQKADFPWGFTEHCTIGAFALHDHRWRDKYHWVDVAVQPWPKPKLAQFWSHSPPEQAQDLPSGGKGVPLETFQKLGLC